MNRDCVPREKPASPAPSTPLAQPVPSALQEDAPESATPASAEPRESAPTAQSEEAEHDHQGFYLHLGIGGGFVWTAPEDSGVSVSGVAVAPSLALGAAVAENWIIAATFEIDSAPSAEFGGEASGDSQKLQLTGMRIGMGVVNYTMPSNIYVLGALSFARMDLNYKETVEVVKGSYSNRVAETAGLGMDLILGKEWWASHDWGIGPMLRISNAFLSENEVQWKYWSITAGISTTYN